MARYVSPSLSCIRVETEEMGATALRLLKTTFFDSEKRNHIPRKITIGTSLVLRESSLK
ncbi:substrate-binding domain-containing protein [Liquorilactobacillus sicerae]|uniref:substrate-binding domain-containing protein n=1 Tax=Liquorilactobacillus sicerae TaxID=1416943 RepID=UPI003D04FCD5